MKFNSNLIADIEDAVNHIMGNIDHCSDFDEKQEYLFHLFYKNGIITEFSLNDLVLFGKHNETFKDMEHDYVNFSKNENLSLEDWYDKTLKEPAIIIVYENKYCVLDGQHRINELILRSIEKSNHFVINLDKIDVENWVIDSLIKTNPYNSL